MIHMVCVALKWFGAWQGGSGGSPPSEEKKRQGDVRYGLRSLKTVQGMAGGSPPGEEKKEKCF